jgi:phage recombination protein Bet
MSAITKHEPSPLPALQMSEGELIEVLATSLYPGASVSAIKMVLGYCKASGLDPMQKPVHIVPMWDNKAGMMRDVVMPGIGLYRTQASRSGECAGVSEPEFGPDVTETIGGQQITFPNWCRVTVKRRLPTGEVVEFNAKEFWKENYAVKGGKDKSIAPNAMWTKRPYGQIAKCAEAQALRKAFPEIGSEPTADEMAGKSLHEDETIIDASTGEITGRKPAVSMPARKPAPAAEAATDVPSKPAATQASTDGTPCTTGEIAYINKKITSRNAAIADVFESAGLPRRDTLDGLNKDEFNALKDVLV